MAPEDNPMDEMQISQDEYELNEICASLTDEEARILDAYILRRVANAKRQALGRLRPYIAHHALSCNLNNQQAWDEAMQALTDIPPEVRADPAEMYAIEQAQAEVVAKRMKCTCGFAELVAELDQHT